MAEQHTMAIHPVHSQAPVQGSGSKEPSRRGRPEAPPSTLLSPAVHKGPHREAPAALTDETCRAAAKL